MASHFDVPEEAMLPTYLKPTHSLYLLWIAALFISAICIGYLLRQPWLGLEFTPNGSSVLAASAAPNSGKIPANAYLRSISAADSKSMAINANDLTEDPDFLETSASMNIFLARQGLLHEILQTGHVILHLETGSGKKLDIPVNTRHRPIASLPATFWLQWFVALSGLMIGSWIYLLRPDDWGARMFALTGISLFISLMPAAIYSSRELALDSTSFFLLSRINHFFALCFGTALINMFLAYPRLIVRPVTLFIPIALFLPWAIADSTQAIYMTFFSIQLPMLLQCITVVVLAASQWLIARKNPVDRASLRWMLLSIMVGCLLVAFGVIGSRFGNIFPEIPQADAAGFFLIMYLGMALGLSRHRLFNLDAWAYRVMLWSAGAALILLMDIFFIWTGLGRSDSLFLTVLITGVIYFPIRQFLWTKIVAKGSVKIESLLPDLSLIALTHEVESREQLWTRFLQALFSPLEIDQAPVEDSAAIIAEHGLTLFVPACGGMDGMKMRYAGQGERLFSGKDAALIDSVTGLMDQIVSGRENYERGVNRERSRITRDLHDNLGARLLKLIHSLRNTPGADIARDAMKDLRTTISALDGSTMPLCDAAADWRAEIHLRCSSAGVALSWTARNIDQALMIRPAARASLESLLREAVTNALKHASPQAIRVDIGMQSTSDLTIVVANDGVTTDPENWTEGYGLRNIRSRVRELRGCADFRRHESRVAMSCTIPAKSLS